MLSSGRTELWAAAFLATLMLEVAASPSPYAGFELDDVRRPVYRGNMRYKRHSLDRIMESRVDSDTSRIISHAPDSHSHPHHLPLHISLEPRYRDDRSGRNNEGLEHYIAAKGDESEGKLKYEELEVNHSEEFENDSWAMIPMIPSISENNHTKSLIKNFFKNSLKVLKNPSATKKDFLRPTVMKKESESLDKLILSHTKGPIPIQMYPEGRPPHWGGKPDPTVILIEDVHPSKLPKPDHSTPSTNHYQAGSWPYGPNGDDPYGVIWSKPNNQSSKPHTPVILVEDVHPSKLPQPPNQWGQQKPTIKPEQDGSWNRPFVVIKPKPSPPSMSTHHETQYKPITVRPKPDPPNLKPSLVKPVTESYAELSTTVNKPNKPVQLYPKPITVKPVFLHPKPLKPTKKPSYASNPTEIRPAILHEVQITTQTGFTSSKPSSAGVVYNSFNYTKPVTLRPVSQPPNSYRPIYVSHTHISSGGYPGYSPVPVYHNPGPRPEPPPKPHVPIHPPLNESPRPPEAPYRDPPLRPNKPLGSTIILSQASTLPPFTAPSRPPPPSIVILEAEPEPEIEDCGTIHIVNDIKSQKSCSDVMILMNSPMAVASGGGSAAAGGNSAIAAASGASIAAGAAAAGAAGASLAAGAAGVAAGGASIAAGAAAGAAGAAGAALGAAGAPGSQTITLPGSAVSPALQPLADETSSEEDDYDYSEEMTASPSPTPTRPPTAFMTLYDYISSFASSTLPFIAPFGVSLWVIVLGPLAFMLVGVIGVGALIFPWILPRLFLGRRKRRSLFRPKIPHSALLFLKNMNDNKFDKYD